MLLTKKATFEFAAKLDQVWLASAICNTNAQSTRVVCWLATRPFSSLQIRFARLAHSNQIVDEMRCDRDKLMLVLAIAISSAVCCQWSLPWNCNGLARFEKQFGRPFILVSWTIPLELDLAVAQIFAPGPRRKLLCKLNGNKRIERETFTTIEMRCAVCIEKRHPLFAWTFLVCLPILSAIENNEQVEFQWRRFCSGAAKRVTNVADAILAQWAIMLAVASMAHSLQKASNQPTNKHQQRPRL